MTRRVQWADVWWVETPALSRRPAVVVSRPEALEVLPRIVVVPATRTVRGLPTEIHLDEDDGMPVPCVLNPDTPESVPRSMLVERITTLPTARSGNPPPARVQGRSARFLSRLFPTA